ncbi:CPBP family intramembrane glutamic endopeptidase [Kutzneria albida]|uniref:CAAX prenyl protease 2/Lysostaphin resistance protein A-like domain-containing protein n=1 Tax=Kutzneria albida DSM 43870 TaxID=1449976 RepID=W5WK11_9PSEU|nr:CPBP family intramembrane glutamic endopeptidase [Kutzneria albida]AHI01086.1 hypothetical protein KALB_7728 [Kutzneria albida DSM 43870]
MSTAKIARNQVATFLLLAFAGAWAVTIPLWGSGFQRTSTTQVDGPWVQVIIAAMMATPALAALAVTRSVRAVGLVWPRGQWRHCLTGFGVPTAILLLSLGLSSALGVFPVDLGHVQVGGILLSYLVSLPLFLGEELGWQGFLLPRLLPLGAWPALLAGGVVWGLWHAPVTVLGAQYPGHPPLVGLVCVLVSTVLIGVLIGFLRLVTGSVWPTVLAHAVVSQLAPDLIKAVSAGGRAVDPLLVGPASVVSWLLAAGLILVLRKRVGESGHPARPALEH